MLIPMGMIHIRPADSCKLDGAGGIAGPGLATGYALARALQLRLDVFNLFNAQTNDISYYYTSRLPGEPAQGVEDRHLHPGELRSFRVSLSYRF